MSNNSGRHTSPSETTIIDFGETDSTTLDLKPLRIGLTSTLILCGLLSGVMTIQSLVLSISSVAFSASIGIALQTAIIFGFLVLPSVVAFFRPIVWMTLMVFLATSMLTGAIFLYSLGGYTESVFDAKSKTHSNALRIGTQIELRAKSELNALTSMLRQAENDIDVERKTGNYGERLSGCGPVCAALMRKRDEIQQEVATQEIEVGKIEAAIADLDVLRPEMSEVRQLHGLDQFLELFQDDSAISWSSIVSPPSIAQLDKANSYFLDVNAKVDRLQQFATAAELDTLEERFPLQQNMHGPVEKFTQDVLAIFSAGTPGPGIMGSFWGVIPDGITLIVGIWLFLLGKKSPDIPRTERLSAFVTWPFRLSAQIVQKIQKVLLPGGLADTLVTLILWLPKLAVRLGIGFVRTFREAERDEDLRTPQSKTVAVHKTLSGMTRNELIRTFTLAQALHGIENTSKISPRQAIHELNAAMASDDDLGLVYKVPTGTPLMTFCMALCKVEYLIPRGHTKPRSGEKHALYTVTANDDIVEFCSIIFVLFNQIDSAKQILDSVPLRFKRTNANTILDESPPPTDGGHPPTDGDGVRAASSCGKDLRTDARSKTFTASEEDRVGGQTTASRTNVFMLRPKKRKTT